jgi:hypothetical protein
MVNHLKTLGRAVHQKTQATVMEDQTLHLYHLNVRWVNL